MPWPHKILSVLLLIGFTLSAGDGVLLAGISDSRRENTVRASCCGTATCCCKPGAAKGGSCAMDADREMDVPASGFDCRMQASNCNPETGLPQPLATRHLTPPVPLAGLSYTPHVSLLHPLSTPAPSDPFNPSLFRPPRV